MKEMNPLKYPIGVQNFPSLRENGWLYVDKTAYIHELVNDATPFAFLSRPRRFGKSLLISTLEAYFKGQREPFRYDLQNTSHRHILHHPFHLPLPHFPVRKTDDVITGYLFPVSMYRGTRRCLFILCHFPPAERKMEVYSPVHSGSRVYAIAGQYHIFQEFRRPDSR